MTPRTSLFYRLMRGLVCIIHRCCFPVTTIGLEHLESLKGQPFLLAGNHTGFLDGSILLSASPVPLRFFSTDSILHWPVVGLILRLMGAIPIQPQSPRRGLAHAVEVLCAGGAVCVFPEGKLTTTIRYNRRKTQEMVDSMKNW